MLPDATLKSPKRATPARSSLQRILPIYWPSPELIDRPSAFGNCGQFPNPTEPPGHPLLLGSSVIFYGSADVTRGNRVLRSEPSALRWPRHADGGRRPSIAGHCTTLRQDPGGCSFAWLIPVARTSRRWVRLHYADGLQLRAAAHPSYRGGSAQMIRSEATERPGPRRGNVHGKTDLCRL